MRDEFPIHVRKVYLTDGKEDFSKNKVLQKFQLLQRRRKLEKLAKNPAIIDKEFLKDHYDIEIGMTYNDFEPVLNSSNKNSKKIGWFHSEINAKGFEPLVPPILAQFPQFDMMVYCSQRIHDVMHESHPDLPYPAENVIINAIPIDEIKMKAQQKIENFRDDVPTFISIGRLHYRKGYHVLIEAHARLVADGLFHKILIIGEGEQKPELEQLIKKYRLENSIILLGNKMNPYPYVKMSDFFILPSQSEAWPLVIAEAMILGKPIIATDTGDVSKMIAHKKTGFLIGFREDEMYAAIKEFLTNPGLVTYLKKNLIDIEEHFDNRKIFESVEQMLLEIHEQPNTNHHEPIY